MNGAVTNIVQLNFKSGTNAKTGKPWVIHRYEANADGKTIEFTSFDELVIGDEVRLDKNEYGWNGNKPRKADTQHDEVMKALKALYAKMIEIEKAIKGE